MTDHEKCYKSQTLGFALARKYFEWQRLEKCEEYAIAKQLVRLGEFLDKELEKRL